jgi:hypothetical protein
MTTLPGRASVNVTANGTLSYAITVNAQGGVSAASIPLANGFPVAAQAVPATGNPALFVLALLLGAMAL